MGKDSGGDKAGGSHRGRRRVEHPLRAALCALLPLLFLPAAAWGGQSISVTPARVPVIVTAGDKAAAEVTVINHGEEGMRLLPQVLSVMESDHGELRFGMDEGCRWVTLEESELFLGPKSDRRFRVDIEPPRGAAPGSYRLALTFVKEPEGAGEIGIAEGLAVLLELEVLAAERAGGSFPLWLPASLGGMLLFLIAVLLILRRTGRPDVPVASAATCDEDAQGGRER